VGLLQHRRTSDEDPIIRNAGEACNALRRRSTAATHSNASSAAGVRVRLIEENSSSESSLLLSTYKL
jgi:hypothetical protein